MKSDTYFIEELIEKIKQLEKRVEKLEALSDPGQLAGASESVTKRRNKPLSIKEFLKSKNPKNDVERALAIGFFLERYKEMESFTVKDLITGYRDAKNRVPGNTNDKVNMNIRKGFIDKAGGPKGSSKSWVLTQSGEDFVENDFRTSENG